jgi:hypothetical protein
VSKCRERRTDGGCSVEPSRPRHGGRENDSPSNLYRERHGTLAARWAPRPVCESRKSPVLTPIGRQLLSRLEGFHWTRAFPTHDSSGTRAGQVCPERRRTLPSSEVPVRLRRLCHDHGTGMSTRAPTADWEGRPRRDRILVLAISRGRHWSSSVRLDSRPTRAWDSCCDRRAGWRLGRRLQEHEQFGRWKWRADWPVTTSRASDAEAYAELSKA